MTALSRRLAGMVATLHYGYLAYLITGGFLAWRWPRTISLHGLAAAWATLIVTTRVPCPLTALQNRLRERAGQQRLSGSFIDLYVRGRFFPSAGQPAAQKITGLLILTSWVGLLFRRRTSALGQI